MSKELGVPVVIGLAAGVCLILAISFSVAWSIAPNSSATKDNPVGFAASVTGLAEQQMCIVSLVQI